VSIDELLVGGILPEQNENDGRQRRAVSGLARLQFAAGPKDRNVQPGWPPNHLGPNQDAHMLAMTARESSAPESLFVIERGSGSDLRIAGKLTLANARDLWEEVSRQVAGLAEGESLNFDMRQVASVDGGALALLVHLRSHLLLRGVDCEFVHSNDRVHELVHLYRGDVDPTPRRKRRPQSAIEQIGRATVSLLREAQLGFDFLGTSVLAAAGLLREPRTANWKAVLPIMERAGVDAVPIVLLINFLVGFVMAFQGAVQLKQFGANIYVADLVGLSVVRELGPLMTAIIVCGRSGAAFAAELGTMKVSEEIDALRTLGFGPIRYLVLPRVLSLMVVMPILTLFADLVGVFGGMVVGLVSLDLTPTGYLIETKKALTLFDVGSGLFKSAVFAIAIAVISCQQGFATSGGAEGVGRRTTASVVSILFSLILIDAGFTVFFYQFHL
jgi:phospholipid/cholesterol/gamma-HCH transport system permease protein